MLAVLTFSSVAAISMASYAAVSYNTLKVADNRVIASNQVLEAENALEETLYSVSNESLDSWSVDGSSATKTVTGVELSTLADALPVDFTEVVTITPAPRVVTERETAFANFFRSLGFSVAEPEPTPEVAEVDPDAVELTLSGLEDDSDQRTLTLSQSKTLEDGSIEVRTLTATMSPLPAFQQAIVTKNNIRMRKDGVIDSYDSSVGTYSDNNSGHEAVLSGSYVSVSRAQVDGFAASANRSAYFGRRSTLQGPETDSRTAVDTTRIIPTPYKANLDTVEASGVGSMYRGPNTSLGSPDSSEPRVYYANDLNLRNNEQITIEGPTYLVVDGDINLSDNASIFVRENASLEIHVDGNVNLDGQGIVNQSQRPENVAIIGTNSDTRSIVFQGDNALYGAVYAPNSNFYTYGRRTTRDIYGAIVAKKVVFNDATNFHFDVSLRDATFKGIEKAYAFDSED